MPKWLLRDLRRFEPARVRAAWTAVVALALTLGVAVPADVDARVTALIALAAVLLPLVQGESTRAAVIPVAKLDGTVDGLDPQDALTAYYVAAADVDHDPAPDDPAAA